MYGAGGFPRNGKMYELNCLNIVAFLGKSLDCETLCLKGDLEQEPYGKQENTLIHK